MTIVMRGAPRSYFIAYPVPVLGVLDQVLIGPGPGVLDAPSSLTKGEYFLDANQFAVFAVEIGQAGLFPSTRCVA